MKNFSRILFFTIVGLFLLCPTSLFAQKGKTTTKASPKSTSKKINATHTKPNPAQPKWYKFDSGEFTVDFPVEPNNVSDPGGAYIYRASDSNISFVLNYLVFRLNPSNQGDDALAAKGDIAPDFGKRIMEGPGSEIVQSRRVRKGIAETELWLLKDLTKKDEKNHALRRDIVGNQPDTIGQQRLVTLMCGAKIPNEKLDDRVCARFFNSFSFTSETQNASNSQKDTKVCPVCHGSGHVSYTGACQRCGGSGKEEDGESCHLCHGTGSQVGVKKTCPHCNGVGRLKK